MDIGRGTHVAVLATDIEWIKKAIEDQHATLRDHTETLGEIRDLATKTNGRVNQHDKDIEVLQKKAEVSGAFVAKLGGMGAVGGFVAAILVQLFPFFQHK